MERILPVRSILLFVLLLMLFSLGGCVGYSSVSVGVGVDDYWSPYHRYRPGVSYHYHQRPTKHKGRSVSIGRPHPGPQGSHGTVRRPVPARQPHGHRKR